jgi:FtsJ-like methyltransferase
MVTYDNHVMIDLTRYRENRSINTGGSTGYISPSCGLVLLSYAGVRHVVDLCAAPGSWSQVGLVASIVAFIGMIPSDLS